MFFINRKNSSVISKKLLLVVTAVAIFTFVFALLPAFSGREAWALDTGIDATRDAAGLSDETSIATIIGQIIYAILGFLGVIFVLLLIYGGFLRMTAQGDSGKIKTSTGIITSAVIGVIIIMASYTITAFVLSKITSSVGGGGSNDEEESASGVGDMLPTGDTSPSGPRTTQTTGCCTQTFTIISNNIYYHENRTSNDCDLICAKTSSEDDECVWAQGPCTK